MNAGIIYGLISGMLSMAYISALYVNSPENMLSGLEKYSWLIIVFAMLFGVWRERSMRTEPFIAFQEALKTAFQIFIIAYLIKFTAVYVLFNFIDPALCDRARDIAVSIFTEHKDPDMPQEIFDQQLKAFSKGYFGPRIFDIGVMLEIMIGFVAALFTAFLIKREKPEF